MKIRRCARCGADGGPTDQTCPACGAPLPFAPNEDDVPCTVCGAPLAVTTETCPRCGESGYPALRPRRGRGWRGPPVGERALDRFVVVLHRPQDLVNVALVIRAMKNMGLRELRVVDPAETFDPYRIEGIAHDTRDLVERSRVLPDLDSALSDLHFVVGTSARRRAGRLRWWRPEEAAARLLEAPARLLEAPARLLEAPEQRFALLFGPETQGLTNRELDRCGAVIYIPTEAAHPSMNLAHAAVIVFWELRKRALALGKADLPDLSPKKRRRGPPATAAELEEFFEAWEKAMATIGFFHGIDPLPKMRSFRSIFQRADLDRRELGLLRAVAFEILHYERRLKSRGQTEPLAPDEKDDKRP